MATTSKEGSRRANFPMLIERGSDEDYECYAFKVLAVRMSTI